jgi:hypothetical protein
VLGPFSHLQCFYKLCWFKARSCFELCFHVRYVGDNSGKIWVVWIWGNFYRVKGRGIAGPITEHSNTTSSQVCWRYAKEKRGN